MIEQISGNQPTDEAITRCQGHNLFLYWPSEVGEAIPVSCR